MRTFEMFTMLMENQPVGKTPRGFGGRFPKKADRFIQAYFL